MPGHGQAAATIRAVWCECSDNNLCPQRRSSHQAFYIRAAVVRVCQKVKCGTIVPQTVFLLGLPSGHIGFNPTDLRSACSQPRPSNGQCLLRNIQDADRLVFVLQKSIHQARRTAADIDDRCAAMSARPPDEIERHCRALFEPADLCFILRGIDVLPMRSPVKFSHAAPWLRRLTRCFSAPGRWRR